MSEPSALYCRVRLSFSALDAYLRSLLVPPGAYDDWAGWLTPLPMFGGADRLIAELPQMRPLAGRTVADLLDEWSCAPQGGARSEYHAATQTWRLGMLEFSENYDETVRSLAALRAVATYKDQPGADAILVLPYLFGPEGIKLSVLVEKGSSHLPTPPPDGFESEARAYLRGLFPAGTEGGPTP